MSSTGTMATTELLPPMVPVPDAIRMVLRETARIVRTPNAMPEPTRKVSPEAAPETLIGLVLEEDVIMAEPGYPPYNASIMDGYAIRTSEAFSIDQQPWTHHILDRVYAGDEPTPALPHSNDLGLPSAYYITTGAVLPDGFDCVVPVEEIVVSNDKDHIRILPSATIAPNTWIRPIGCDIPAGSVVLPKGYTIDPVAIGLILQSGAESITVKRPLVIGVLSTGNELLVGTKDTTQSGMIPDVNRPILLNLLSTFGDFCQPLDLGNERDDDAHRMKNTIDHALEKCDVIITTGGVSMGESDIVKKVLIDHCGGTLHFGRMHMKPGKPTTFVTIPKGDAVRLVFAMPGNPVSATVCTQLLVRPCLDLLYHSSCSDVTVPSDEELEEMVGNSLVHGEMEAMLTHDITLDLERPEYHRVTIHKQHDRSYGVTTTGNQRSSRLLSCRGAQALVVLPVGSTTKPKALKGESYPVLLLGNLRGFDPLRCNDSKHLTKRRRPYQVAVIEVVPENQLKLSSLDETASRVKDTLSGLKSGNAEIVCKKTFSGKLDTLYTEIVDSNDADLVVVSCVSFQGAFPFHLDVAAEVRRRLTKSAKALALQARQGAASENAVAALFEVVAGYAPERNGTIVLCLPDIGISGGLNNVRGLLKHSLNVARGKPHNDHHKHSHHDHRTQGGNN